MFSGGTDKVKNTCYKFVEGTNSTYCTSYHAPTINLGVCPSRIKLNLDPPD